MDSKLRKAMEIEVIYDLLDELNYYQLLGLPTDADAAEFEPAFRAQSRVLHPDRVARLGRPELTRQATTIYRMVNEAYRCLKEPESRAQYDDELTQGNVRISDSGRSDAKAAGEASADPDKAARTEKGGKYWRLALQQWRDEDYQGCVMNIQFALNFERDNETFQEWLKKAEDAANEKAKTKQKNPYKLRFF
jgi:DnaJ-class molecular chaperone